MIGNDNQKKLLINSTDLSQARIVQAAMIQSEIEKTSKTVPGQIVIKVFITNLVLKFILLRAPILREEASVNKRECKSITRAIRYNRRNIGIESKISTSAALVA